jgi:uncharacterized SAM-binding protein YcdF (DUF218 family)
MEKISWLFMFLLHPLSIVAIFCSIYFGIFRKSKQRTFKIIFKLVGVVIFWVTSTSFLLRPLITILEKSFDVVVPNEHIGTQSIFIVVLGSGTGHDSRLPATSLLSSTTLMRLVEGIRLARALPDARLITSAKSAEGYRPQAFVARDAAIELGIDSSRIIALPTASNTREEAEAFVAFAGRGAKVIVCTSAIHMPRAMEWFKRAGAQPIAAPCDFIVKKDDPPPGIKAFVPQHELWKTWQFVLKEYLGLLYFRLKQG